MQRAVRFKDAAIALLDDLVEVADFQVAGLAHAATERAIDPVLIKNIGRDVAAKVHEELFVPGQVPLGVPSEGDDAAQQSTTAGIYTSLLISQ